MNAGLKRSICPIINTRAMRRLTASSSSASSGEVAIDSTCACPGGKRSSRSNMAKYSPLIGGVLANLSATFVRSGALPLSRL